jgi:hypothetical protein
VTRTPARFQTLHFYAVSRQITSNLWHSDTASVPYRSRDGKA